MNKKIFSFYITIIPLLIVGIEIFLRILGFGTAFDSFGETLISGEKVSNYLQEIDQNFDENLIGSWKASDITTTTSTTGDIIFTIYNGNTFSKKVIDKKLNDFNKKSLRISECGNYYSFDSRIIFIPFSYKTNNNSVTLSELKQHPDRYAETYQYKIQNNKLILTNIKNNETITLIKYEN